MSRQSDNHWLSRPETVRRLWWAFAIVLAVTVLVQVAFPVQGHFGVDGWFAFGAVFGFGACVVMVFFAKALGVLLKRQDDYYDD